MIDFPTNPALNQTFAAPNGVTYRCTGIDPDVWTSQSTGTAVSEAPADGKLYGRKDVAWSEVTKAALGLGNVTNVAAVAKAGDTMTGPLLLPAGTVAAPALAFSAEAGLGFFRPVASRISVAAQGVQTFMFDATTVNSTLAITPRTAGVGNTNYYNNVSGTANMGMLSVGISTTGAFVSSVAVGTGPALNMAVSGPTVDLISTNGTVRVSATSGNADLTLQKTAYAGVANNFWARVNGTPVWVQVMGAGDAASDFYIQGYDNSGNPRGQSIVAYRNTGQVAFPLGTLGFNINGALGVSAGATVSGGLNVATGNFNVNAGNIYTGAGFGIIAAASITAGAGGFRAPADSSWVTQSTSWGVNGAYRVVYYQNANQIGDSLEFMGWHQPGVKTFWRFNVGGSGNYFDFSNDGVGFASGSWQPGSDGRVKVNRVVITEATARVRALTGYVYDKLTTLKMDGTPLREVGLIAQDVEMVLPDAVSIHDTTLGAKEGAQHVYPDFRALNYGAVTALLVNAFKELDQRLNQLENA